MKIPYFFILLIISVCFCANAGAQIKNEEIAHIRTVFDSINTMPNLNKVELDAEEFLEQSPDGGASLTGYFNGQALVKITKWIGLSYGTLEIEYYFDKENLIFSYVRESHFQLTDSGVNHKNKRLVFEGRYYFDSNGIIEIIKKGTGFWERKRDSNIPISQDAASYSQLLKEKYKGS